MHTFQNELVLQQGVVSGWSYTMPRALKELAPACPATTFS